MLLPKFPTTKGCYNYKWSTINSPQQKGATISNGQLQRPARTLHSRNLKKDLLVDRSSPLRQPNHLRISTSNEVNYCITFLQTHHLADLCLVYINTHTLSPHTNIKNCIAYFQNHCLLIFPKHCMVINYICLYYP